MKKTLLIHDTFLTKGGAERMNIEIAKILDADIATAVWHENGFQIEDFDYTADIFLTTKNFQKGMLGFLKMKLSFFLFSYSLQKKSSPRPAGKEHKDEIKLLESEAYHTFFLSNEASTAVWNLPKNSQKIFYAHSISRHLFDLYDEYLAKVPKIAKIPYRIMAFFLKKLYLAELKKFDIILTNSPANQTRLKEWCNIDSSVLFPPVDTSKFRPLAENERGKIFEKFLKKNSSPRPVREGHENDVKLLGGEGFYISFARVNATKGIDKIISAFSENPNKKLLIIFGTEDSDRENFQKMSGIEPTQEQNIIFQSEKFPNIFWLSLKENSDLSEIVAHATATICMSKNEDFGMVAIESMSAGIPVIAPNEGGYRETIIHRKTGFLLTENSSENLSNFLKNLDEKKLKNMQEDCIAQAEKFSLKNFEKKLKNILETKKSL